MKDHETASFLQIHDKIICTRDNERHRYIVTTGDKKALCVP